MAVISELIKVSDLSFYPIWVMQHGSQPVQVHSQGVQEISRPGLDGHDYQQFGQKAPLTRISIQLDATEESEALALVLWLKSLQGELIKYRDENTRLWQNMICVTVRSTEHVFEPGLGFRYPVYDPDSPLGTSKFQVRAALELRLTEQVTGV
jgi:hypothetical protein